MTMHGALHLKSVIDRVYLSREMGKKGLTSCEGYIRMEEINLEWHVRNSVQLLNEGVKVAETIEYNDTLIKRNSDRDGWGKRTQPARDIPGTFPEGPLKSRSYSGPSVNQYI